MSEPWNDTGPDDYPGCQYYVCAGEGSGEGAWHGCATDSDGVKRHLTAERCNGDRWAFAVADVYRTSDGGYAGHDIESGEVRAVPAYVFAEDETLID